MTAPERIWIAGQLEDCGHYYAEAVEAEGEHGGYAHEYILHTRAALAASPLVQEIVAEAFRAGFNESGEGWNGEYPCNDDAEEWLAVEATEYAAAIRARGEG